MVNKNLPIRKNPRYGNHSYDGGFYFVTLCTKNMCHYFGTVFEGKMKYSKIGEQAKLLLEGIVTRHQHITIHQYIIMPNHIHAIIGISEKVLIHPKKRSELSILIGQYKQAVTRYCKENGIIFGWQRSYFDRIIRNNQEMNQINDYIINNPFNWPHDKYYCN